VFHVLCVFFFFSSRRRHTRSKRDWSSDVCSSDLIMWALFGYSLAFGNDHFGIIGDFSWLGLQGIEGSTTDYVSTIPHLEFAIFQIGRASCRERVCFTVVPILVTDAKKAC